MAAVIGRGFERMAGNSSPSDEVYDPDRSNRGVFQSPFVLYYTVTISMNAVAIIGGISSEFYLHRNNYFYFNYCDAWVFANALFGVVHIGAAFYIVRKIREPVPQPNSDGVFATGYRLHDPRDRKNKQDIEEAAVIEDPVQGQPDSLKRIRYVLCENKVFAVYIFVYLAYLIWHSFLDMMACNLGMALAMRCADIFIWAAPCSFLFSVGALMMRQGRI